eukprot:Protomagalhaensia_wolfi_Nauph_80__4925@NODE_517_length_2393_cov_62_154206_g385_i0_p4_GENE_NODE_517_length_2393_cov_62_154206_g385_i0NODE_517_length_2393_cov_62_154206_g385_i0_p4_ORF_typecomplete_len131_score15_35_NODE_517_length_2393_cov_62_154206_g385_i010231415
MDVSETTVKQSTRPVQPPLTVLTETTGEEIWIPSEDALITTPGGTVYSMWSETPDDVTMSGQTYSDFTTSTAFVQFGLSTEGDEVAYRQRVQYQPRPFEGPYVNLGQAGYARLFDQEAIAEIPLGAYPPL